MVDSRGEKTGQAYHLEGNVPVSDQRDSRFLYQSALNIFKASFVRAR